MNNSYYDSCAQPYCRMPVRAGKCNTPQEYEKECRCKPAYEKASECESKVVPIATENPVAMAYVPVQKINDIYDCSKAMKCGTLFPELNKPFKGCCIYE